MREASRKAQKEAIVRWYILNVVALALTTPLASQLGLWRAEPSLKPDGVCFHIFGAMSHLSLSTSKRRAPRG